MRRIHLSVLFGWLAAAALAIGCPTGPLPTSCEYAAVGECLDYGTGGMAWDGDRSCSLSGGVLRHRACPSLGRVGRCEYGPAPHTGDRPPLSYYAPHTTSDAHADCAIHVPSAPTSRFVPR